MSKEIGSIPYLISHRSLYFIMIRSSSKNRWLFPKGQMESDMSNKKVALMETWEESGIKGTIKGKPYKIIFHKNNKEINLYLYPLEVEKIAEKWPENRKRKICSLKKAIKLSKKAGLSGIKPVLMELNKDLLEQGVSNYKGKK